ncbi:hypothetical protein QUB26_24115, partial [Microcoleus sp. B4-C1]
KLSVGFPKKQYIISYFCILAKSGCSRLKQLSLVLELTFTFTRVMVRLRRWNRELSRSYLRHLFGTAPMVDAPRHVA